MTEMVRVVPFRAYRYDKTKIGDYSKVVAPPYDIIKGPMVDRLQGLSKYNIAWITKNKPEPSDSEHNNQYTRAASLFRKWLQEGALGQDDKESFYAYGQDFEIDGKKLFRFGFIGLMELEDFATKAPKGKQFTGVLQHEETLPKDILDRLNLCRQTFANFGLIFVIYPDAEKKVDSVLEKNMKKAAIMDVVDNENIRHRIWRIDNKKDTDAITSLMASKYVIIADGHHRYKTALALKAENPDLESAKYRMLAFVNIRNPGLVILPTHRVVQNLPDFDRARLLDGVSKHFAVKDFTDKDEMFKFMETQFETGSHCFGLFVNDAKFYAITLKDKNVMREMLPTKSEQLRSLDVSILHALVLEKILGIGKEKLAEGTMSGGGYVTYVKGIGDAVDESIKSVKEGAQAVFFMNPPRIEEVEAVSRNFEIMPQKSTFFHPKVWTGFTINKLK